MADSSDENLFTGMMDEYFAECDEHILAIKRGLLALESSFSLQIIEELFRAFHTVKGLSGMVGFRGAEQLAHKVESYLRTLSATGGSLPQNGLEALMHSVNILEQIISARRFNRPAPDIAQTLKTIDCLIPDEPVSQAVFPSIAAKTGLSPVKISQIAAAQKKGHRIWRFLFSPHPDLMKRGVNINLVRDRLNKAGELIHALPRVVDKEQVVFEFVLASSANPDIFKGWEKDGIRFEPYVMSAVPEKTNIEESSLSLTLTSMVRVDLSRVDELMQKMGELIIRNAHLSETLKKAEQEIPLATRRALQEAFSGLERGVRDVREGVMRIRMVPVRNMFERMRFAIRDLGTLQNKKIRMEFVGEETEIDKYVVDRMIDPMLHLVRNAVSHGIEDPRDRSSLGKPVEGTITLEASMIAERVVLGISDDGRGMDAAEISERAVELGLLRPDEQPGTERLLDIICQTGFTTHSHADTASGRGIGMAVVRKAVEELGGSIRLDTRLGRGSRFTLELPLSLSIQSVLLVHVRDRVFAVPTSSVDDIVEVGPDEPTRLENNEIVPYRGGILPLLRLDRHFRIAGTAPDLAYALVVNAGSGPLGIMVDRLIGQKEIVVHSLSDPFVRVPGIAGATELGDRKVILILDPKAIARMKGSRPESIN